jgi:deoxyribodipyrimidine photo-lyase
MTLLHTEDSLRELLRVAAECGADRVVWNRLYTPAAIARDKHVKAWLRAEGLVATSFNASLLHEPWEVQTKAGGPFQVFTPYWRHCLGRAEPAEPVPAPAQLPAPPAWPRSLALEELDLLPAIDWAAGLRAAWTPGSAVAHAQVRRFLREAFATYGDGRNRPDLAGTSRLSPHLHFGEIGPRQVWAATRAHGLFEAGAASWRNSQFLAEIGWREFAHHLLYHFPSTPERPLRPEFGRFPWRSDPAALAAWQRGTTGYPIVDAGLRELWHTGWMHNRVRMIVGSFLVKDLLMPWNTGAAWFWDTLVDADLASNTLGWQWVAGCGADAAPFFRVFNPALQGAKFDPEGTYVRRWLPELLHVPTTYIHEPWSAPADVLSRAGVALGKDYPHPLVDHQEARKAALEALARVKGTP